MNPLLSAIICCPNCIGVLDFREGSIACSVCSQEYKNAVTDGKIIPVLFSPSSNFAYSPEKGPYGLAKKNSLLSRLARIFWPPEPTRFYGDLQGQFNIKNYHQGIRGFIERFSQKDSVVLIDLGGGKRKLSDNIINIDVFAAPEVDVVADAMFLPVLPTTVDGIILQTVLEHIPQYEDVLKESYRILKPNGLIYCEVPFYYPLHGGADFTRFSRVMLSLLLEDAGFRVMEYAVTTGPFSALSLSFREIASTILSMGRKKLFTAWYIAIGWLTFWIKYLDFFIPPNQMTEQIMPTFYVVAEKSENKK